MYKTFVTVQISDADTINFVVTADHRLTFPVPKRKDLIDRQGMPEIFGQYTYSLVNCSILLIPGL